jgi:hypothetical protein
MLTTRAAAPVTDGASFFFANDGGDVQWGLAAAVKILAALPPHGSGSAQVPADRPLIAGRGGERMNHRVR